MKIYNLPFIFYFLLLGNVYVADRDNCRVRKVTISTGIIATYAGTGSASFSGDEGASTSGGVNYPYGIAIDSAGNCHLHNSP